MLNLLNRINPYNAPTSTNTSKLSQEKASCSPTNLQKYSFVASTLSLIPTYTNYDYPFGSNYILYGARSILNLRQLRASLDTKWKKRFAFLGWLLLPIPIAGSVYKAWETSHIARQSIKGLIACLNDTKKPLKFKITSAFVHTANLTQTIFSLYSQVMYDRFFILYGSHFKKLLDIDPHSSEACDLVTLCTGRGQTRTSDSFEKCPKIIPFSSYFLSDIQRILGLNPNCANHAFEIIAPGINYCDKSAVKQSYRRLQALFHPDRCKKIYCKNVSIILVQALEKVNNLWKNNPYFNQTTFDSFPEKRSVLALLPAP